MIGPIGNHIGPIGNHIPIGQNYIMGRNYMSHEGHQFMMGSWHEDPFAVLLCVGAWCLDSWFAQFINLQLQE